VDRLAATFAELHADPDLDALAFALAVSATSTVDDGTRRSGAGWSARRRPATPR